MKKNVSHPLPCIFLLYLLPNSLLCLQLYSYCRLLISPLTHLPPLHFPTIEQLSFMHVMSEIVRLLFVVDIEIGPNAVNPITAVEDGHRR